MSKITIGKTADGDCRLDVPRLIASRALVTADSGGGKSYLLRKILEEISKSTQTIVIDPEGEFASLREIRDMVLVGPDGELAAEPAMASLLARKLVELHLSAIIQIEELTPLRRQEFVANFCNAMVALPRNLWHPCIIAIDEIHDFAPEGKPSQSGEAIAGLSSKGRKRGFCLIGATQRLAKLANDTAAGMKNNFLGTFSLDTDIKRASGILGFNRDRWGEIRDLSSEHSGEFFSFGPALNHRGVAKMRGGQVQTTHPEPGMGRKMRPPEPSDKIKSVLQQLIGIPAAASEEVDNLAKARRRIVELEKELKAKPAAAGQDDLLRRVRSIMEKLMGETPPQSPVEIVRAGMEKIRGTLSEMAKVVEQFGREDSVFRLRLQKHLEELQKLCGAPPATQVAPGHYAATWKPDAKPPESSVSITRNSLTSYSDAILNAGERKILTACVHHGGCTREQLSILTGYKRSTRDKYLQRLAEKKWIDANNGDMRATPDGIAALGEYEPLPTGEALRKHWMDKLAEGEKKILEAVYSVYPGTMQRDTISGATGYKRSTRDKYIQRMLAAKIIEVPSPGHIGMSKALAD